MRREDWLAQLWRTLEEAEHEPFEFGRHDCAHLVARVLEAMTGNPLWKCFADACCPDARGAAEIMHKPGALEGLTTMYMRVIYPGAVAVPIGLACRGDVLALNLERGPALGICVGERVAVAAEEGGVLYLPLGRAHCGWRVE